MANLIETTKLVENSWIAVANMKALGIEWWGPPSSSCAVVDDYGHPHSGGSQRNSPRALRVFGLMVIHFHEVIIHHLGDGFKHVFTVLWFYACIVVDIMILYFHVFSLVLGGDNLIWVICSTWIEKWTNSSLLAGEMSVLPRYAGKLLLPFVQEFLKVVSEAGYVSLCFFDVSASKVFRVAMETWTARLGSDIYSIYVYLDKN